MSPQLIEAVAERIKAGRPVTEIINELIATGYTAEVANEAYVVALNQLSPTPGLTPVKPSAEAYQGTTNTFVTATAGTELISFGDLFSQSWQLAKDQLHQLLQLGLVILVIASAVIGLVISMESPSMIFMIFILSIFLFIPVLVLLSIILMRVLIARHLKQTLTAHIIWVFSHFWQLLLVAILTGLIYQIGFMLFVIPGLIAFVYFMFATPLVIDGRATAIEGMKLSVDYVKGRFSSLLGRLLAINIFVIIFSVVYFLLVYVFMVIPLWLLNLFLPVFVFLMYWSICGLVVLYESVRSLPLAK